MLINSIKLDKKNSCWPTILLIDSGIGGLSIYQHLWERFPNFHYIYAFDNDGFPYGELTAVEIAKRVLSIVELVQQRHLINLLIVACNTASVVTLSLLRKKWSFPIVGVVPAIKTAISSSSNGVIGLLATPATIKASYIDQLAQQATRKCHIRRLGTSTLVWLAENKLRGQTPSSTTIEKILLPWLQQEPFLDTIVLGCTHFSFLREELSQIVTEKVALIDSIAAIVRQVERLLLTSLNINKSLLVEQRYQICSTTKNQAYCTNLNRWVSALYPILQQYRFSSLQEISLGKKI